MTDPMAAASPREKKGIPDKLRDSFSFVNAVLTALCRQILLSVIQEIHGIDQNTEGGRERRRVADVPKARIRLYAHKEREGQTNQKDLQQSLHHGSNRRLVSVIVADEGKEHGG